MKNSVVVIVYITVITMGLVTLASFFLCAVLLGSNFDKVDTTSTTTTSTNANVVIKNGKPLILNNVNNEFSVGLKQSDSTTQSCNYSLPPNYGTTSQYLSTNGNQEMEWSDLPSPFPVSLGGTNSTEILVGNKMMRSSGGEIVEYPTLLDGQFISGSGLSGTNFTAGTNMVVTNGPNNITLGIIDSPSVTNFTITSGTTVSNTIKIPRYFNYSGLSATTTYFQLGNVIIQFAKPITQFANNSSVVIPLALPYTSATSYTAFVFPQYSSTALNVYTGFRLSVTNQTTTTFTILAPVTGVIGGGSVRCSWFAIGY